MSRKRPAKPAQSEVELRNTLSSLVGGAFAQTNLTSFNPILQNNIYAPLTINYTMLMYMYKTHGVIQTAMEVPVLDAMRGGLDIRSGELDKDDVKALEDFAEESGVWDAVTEAMVWARLFGGAALIINTDQDPETPLTDRPIKKLELYAAIRWELTTGTGWKPGTSTLLDFAPKDSDYFYFYGRRIHKSRIITLSGKAAPYILRWQLAGWGMSEVERMVEDFNKYIKTENVLYELLEEAKIDVYRLEGLNAQLGSAAGTNLTQQRIQLMNQLKNFNRAIVMDTKDEYEQKQLTFSGLAEVKKENRIGLAAALRIPMTKLFGLSASGFNSGEDDIENYNAMVESEVRQKLRRPLRKVLNLLTLALFGEKLDIDFKFKPLRVMSAPEEEQVKRSRQDRIMQLYDRSLMSSQEVGEALEKEQLSSIDLDAAKGLLDDHPMPEASAGGEGQSETGKPKTQGEKPPV